MSKYRLAQGLACRARDLSFWYSFVMTTVEEREPSKRNGIAQAPQGDSVSFEGVKKLAALARIEVKPDELEKFTKEFDAILAYVSQLEKLELPADLKTAPRLRNVFRADENPTESGTWTKKLVDAFPEKKDNYLVVKQIISHG
jgi:aspartyl-tRNA(Asn)/glutamyl-tRNA(Gln) amidotransferase subunit C